jgi:type III restriction enzyme
MNQITSFELHDYQKKAAQELTEKYWKYRQTPLKIKQQSLPFLKILSSVTGSGKTAILAQTVSNLLSYYSTTQPLTFWLSCNKVVVEQTARNLKGKYQSLIPQTRVKTFLNISPSDIAQLDTPLIYVDTIQKFSVQNKETRLIYQVQPDKGDKSAWELIKERKDPLTKQKRDLIVIYDEAHNLTDNQVEKILELSPQALILASGTPSLPNKLGEIGKELKDNGFDPLYKIPFVKVKEKQMVKGKVALGGYKSQMEEILNEMIDKDWTMLKRATEKENLPIPKIIYVCKTNVLELSSPSGIKRNKKDDSEVLFDLRNAPPILIWRHLVKRKGIDPDTIAIYADVEVAKEEKYALDIEFQRNLFNKGKSSPPGNDYKKFREGNYQHIIFNKSLAEGWDDPMVYLAYVDKTIGSEVAIEQIIGRVLRQPFGKYYASEELNQAYFHIRVDENKVFEKIIDELNEKLAVPLDDIIIRDKTSPVVYTKDLPPSKIGKKVPFLTWDSEYIQRKLQRIVNQIPNYERDFPPEHRQNIGKVRRTVKDLGNPNIIQDPVWEENFGLENMVPAQVILRRVIINKNTKVWNMLEWEDPKFKVEIGWGSEADKELREVGEKLINTYQKESLLRISLEKPYEVKGIRINKNPDKCVEYKNAIHSKYSDLNNIEKKTAAVLDNLVEIDDWCRNPAHYGYGIELIDEMGLTQNFFPDFLFWVGEIVVCLEVTAQFLEEDKLKRKLVRIAEAGEEMIEEMPKKVKLIILIQYGGTKEGSEVYYKVWYRRRKDGERESIKVENISEALTVILRDLV